MGTLLRRFGLGAAAMMSACGFAFSETPGSAPAENILWIADFNDGKLITNLNGGIGAWQFDPNDQSSWCEAAVSPQEVHFGEPGNSMRIEYNVSSGKENFVTGQNSVSAQEVGFHGQAFNGVYVLLNQLDATPYKYLVFSARGDAEAGFSRKFKLELKDASRTQSVSFDKLTSKWQKFYIALDPFSSTLTLKSLKELIFVFDRTMTRASGAMYIDDIYFAKSKEPEQALAAGFADLSTTYGAPRAKSIVVDGVLSDWPKIPAVALGPKNVEFGEIVSRRDLAADVRFLWDSQYLYVAALVKDNDVICGKSGTEIYQNDLVELFIDPQNDGLVWSSTADFQIGFAPTGPARRPQSWAWFQNREPTLDNVIFNAKQVRGGYVVEAAIAWEFLKMQPINNQTIGLSVAVHDVDRKKKTETKLNWRFVQNAIDTQRYALGVLSLSEQ